MRALRTCLLALPIAAIATGAGAAEYLQPVNPQRAYSAGVVTDGEKIVWLAGMGGTRDAGGQPIKDFAGQTRQTFRNIEAALMQPAARSATSSP